jgi:flagellar biosynthesis/type III secretory pathway M-ring protein FliF/YscJ
MDAWNVAILLTAAYVAVITLARLMIRRRNQMLEQFRQEVEKEKRRREVERPKAPPKREQAA